MDGPEKPVVRQSQGWRQSSRLLLVVVTIAAFLDNMLISTVVPILPRFLLEIEKANSEPANLTRWSTPLPDASSLELLNSTADTSNATIAPTPNTSPAELSHTTGAPNGTSYSFQAGCFSSSDTSEDKSKVLKEESTNLGVLLASKSFVQLLINPSVGFFANKFGNRRMMLSGFIVMFLSTLLFGFGNTYIVLLVARSLQGVSSSFTTIVGMTILADTYEDDKERQYAMGLALGGLGLGLSVGPPFGGATYQYLNKHAPFLILCGLIFIDGWLLFFSTHTKNTKKKKNIKQTSMITLIRDPYILIVAGGVFLTCGMYTLLESTLPLRVMEILCLNSVQFGLIFMPYPVFFLFVTTVTGKLLLKVKRWLLSFLGVILTGLPLLLYPYCSSFYELLVPSAIMGVGAGLVDIALMPEIAHLVDIRHTAVYGNAFAIEDIAVCLGLTLGPLCGSISYKVIGFFWIMFGGCAVCLIYVPFVFFLRNPPVKNRGGLDGLPLNGPPVTKTLIQKTNDRETGT